MHGLIDGDSNYRIGKSHTGRADLLRFLHLLGETAMATMAFCAGYDKPEKKTDQENNEEKREQAPPVSIAPKDDNPQILVPSNESAALYWVASTFRAKKEDEVQREAPAWYGEVQPFKDDELKTNREISPPTALPLVPWSRLWPFIRGVLGIHHDTRQIDIERVIDHVTKCQPLARLPRRRRKGWASHCQLILDFSERLLPFWQDQADLYFHIKHLRGKSGLTVLAAENGPYGEFRYWDSGPYGSSEGYRLPEPGTPILVIGDLGLLDARQNERESWFSFGKHLRKAGFYPVALCMSPRRLWDADMADTWRMMCWDRGESLPRFDHPYAKGVRPLLEEEDKDKTIYSVAALLTLLSPAIRVEPALLRAVRFLLPKEEADAGTEAGVWNHPDTVTCPLGFTLNKDKIEDYRNEFRKLNDRSLRKKAIEIIEQYHRHLSEAVRSEEKYNCSNLTDAETKEAELFMKRFIKTLDDGSFDNREGMTHWFHRFTGRQHREMWQQQEEVLAAWAAVNRESYQKGEIPLPPGVENIDKISWVLERHPEPVDWLWSRKGSHFVIEEFRANRNQWDNNWVDWGSPMANLMTRNIVLTVNIEDEQSHAVKTIALQKGKADSMPVPEQGQMIVNTDEAELIIEPMVKPKWADSIGCDRYGLFADFSIKGVTQRMRWIRPGRFMMGSPNNEPERDDDERLHEVILTHGFWLADTCCTQALWQAVMKKNPSHFKGNNRPVERVSWEDCQTFIDRINQKKKDLDLRLPTEAEWEYACRAGTTTPFSFGKTITPEQVNYNGKFPYAVGKEGKYREETVDVKSLPCNNWGLYEMHGNVWEWCSDWFGDYPTELILDPKGPDLGDSRVLRGGGWLNDARYVRSAMRGSFDPGFRDGLIGFRLSRGPWGGSDPAGR
ncbi:MAG: formylglycine-generating enzyme family protein [Candidatus Omnitrophota bacterium]